MSLAVCKQLGLVHQNFPSPIVEIASSTLDSMATSSVDDVAASAPAKKTAKIKKPVTKFSDSPKKSDCGPTKAITTNLLVKPSEMPFSPLEENIHRLETWLLQHFSCATFDTNKRPFPVMEGAPHHIHIMPDAKPYAAHVPANVPLHWEAEVKKGLDDDVAFGIICPVPQGEATEWCSRMVVTGKKDGHPRRTVDFQKLNASSLRETHYTPTPFDLV